MFCITSVSSKIFFTVYCCCFLVVHAFNVTVTERKILFIFNWSFVRSGTVLILVSFNFVFFSKIVLFSTAFRISTALVKQINYVCHLLYFSPRKRIVRYSFPSEFLTETIWNQLAERLWMLITNRRSL